MAGEHARRDAYERRYADYRDAQRAYDEARARGAHTAELDYRRRLVVLRWQRLTAWRREEQHRSGRVALRAAAPGGHETPGSSGG